MWAAAAVLALPATVLFYMLAAWVGSSLSRGSDRVPPAGGITIMVETNGLHTGIVMPVVSDIEDWRTTFPSAGRPRADGRMPTHIAVGWGEKEVFLNTPTWADLKPSTALRIAFTGGEGLMRVGHYAYPRPSDHHRPVVLRPGEYRRLVQAVKRALPPLPPGGTRHSYDSFEPGARNYDAAGRYSLAATCNQWVGDALAEAGLPMGRWTPLAGGVMKWIAKPDRRRQVSLRETRRSPA